jgi:hypothetical protein
MAGPLCINTPCFSKEFRWFYQKKLSLLNTFPDSNILFYLFICKIESFITDSSFILTSWLYLNNCKKINFKIQIYFLQLFPSILNNFSNYEKQNACISTSCWTVELEKKLQT